MKELIRHLTGTRGRLFFAALLFAVPFWFGAAAFCSFLAPVMLFFALSKLRAGTGLKRFFRLGFWFGFWFHALIYHWLFALYPFEVANLSKPVAVLVALLAYFGASAIHALYFALAFVLWGVLGRRLSRIWRAGLFCVCFVLAEFIKELGTLALPWSRVALPLANLPVTISVSALIGPYGVDLLLLLFGAAVYGALTARAKKRVICIALALVCVCFDLGYGFGRMLGKQTSKTLRVAVVQTNYPSAEKWDTDPAEVKKTLERLATQASEDGAQWILFPESVLAVREKAYSGAESFFARLSKKTGAIIAAGAICTDGEDTYNAVCVYDETGMLGYNGKRHLVPFGEYLPWQSALKLVLPDLANMTYYRNTYTAETNALAGSARGVTAGGLVCFDSLFPVLSRESAASGADLLLIATNDSWFKASGALQQHLWQACFRAAETDRAVAQAANAGISALVSRGGAEVIAVPALTEGVVVADLELSDTVTLYTQTGDLVILLCLAVVLGFVIRRVSFRRRGRAV